MKKILLALMLMTGVVSASQEEDYHELIVEDETAIVMIGSGSVISTVSIIGVLLDIPEVFMPVAVGGLVVGAALAVSGFTKAAVAGFVQQRVDEYEVIKE